MSDTTNTITWLSSHLKALIDHGEWLQKIESLESYERELKERISTSMSEITSNTFSLDTLKSDFEQLKGEMASYVEGAKKEAESILASARAKEAEVVAQATQVAEDIKKAAQEASKALQDAIAEGTTEYNVLLQSIADKQKVEAEVQSRLDALKKKMP